jgi:uncharacterized protein (TIGR02145 family)
VKLVKIKSVYLTNDDKMNSMRKASLILIAIVVTIMSVYSCQGDNFNEESTTIEESTSTTIEESVINEVIIGKQVWTAANLNVDKFRNGEPIPHAKTDEEWKKAGENKEPAWCYYDNDPTNGEKYGKLYNWYAAIDPRGLAPDGWHLPSDKEWAVLADYLGGDGVAGTKMKSSSGWVDNGNGTNESGFSGTPGGYRFINGRFYYIDFYGYWWSSTESSDNFAWFRELLFFNDKVGKNEFTKGNGYSIRCLRD